MPLDRWIPLLQATRGYHAGMFRSDLTAGLTTAIMLVPQAMAYALLAGLDPIVGLYAATIPTAVYAILGTSRQLSVGPVALDSMLVAGGVAPLAGDDPVLYATLATLLMVMVGALQLTMGMARLGFLVKFLSRPVIAGFTTAAALIIGFSQIKHLLGIPVGRSAYLHEMVIDAVRFAPESHVYTVVIGVVAVATLMVLKRYTPRFPRFLAVVGVGTLVVWALGLDAGGVQTVGGVPSGLPDLVLPTVTVDALIALFPTAAAISLVAFMETISVGKRLARGSGYEIDANQELRAVGAANLAGSLFQGYPVTGGFARSAVNAQAGARTGVASLVTAGVVALSLLFLTPLFFYLPKAVLAAIIMTAVFGLVDVAEAKNLWRVARPDFALMGITFVATLTTGIAMGIGVGVAASLLWFVVANAKPHVAVLGQVPGASIYRNLKRFPDAIQTPGVVALRIDAPLFFANTAFLSETVVGLVDAQAVPVHSVVLDAAAIGSVDSSGADALVELAQTLVDRDIELWLCTVRGPIRDVLQLIGAHDVVPRDHLVSRVHDAMEQIRAAHEA